MLLRSSDVAIYLMDDTLISRSKCPVKLADIIAAGVPVVAEDVGQVPQYVINGATGLLRASGDIAGLTGDIAYLLQSRKQRMEFGQAAQRRYTANFSWDHLAARLDEVYRC